MARGNIAIDLLLEPISPDAPAGESLRYDPVYDRIQQARVDEPALSQGVWQREMRHADWNVVADLCCEALATRTKDLQLAVWLTEAWLHLYGLPGFSAGCSLIEQLHVRFPAQLLPAPEQRSGADQASGEFTLPFPETDPGIEHRLNLLQWMNEKLFVSLKLLPLTAPVEQSELPPVSLADVEAALHTRQAERRAGGVVDKTPHDAIFRRGLELTPPEHLETLWGQLQDASSAVERLSATLDQCYGEENGSLLQIHDTLQQMIFAVAPAVDPEPALPGQPTEQHQPLRTEEPAAPHLSLPAPHCAPAGAVLPLVETRAQAYVALSQIAGFLARLEPHSPVPYLLHRAIAWGEMDLMELLPELLQIQSALNAAKPKATTALVS